MSSRIAPPDMPPAADATPGVDGNGAAPQTPGQAWSQAAAAFAALREYGAYYVATQLDAIKLKVRNITLLAAAGVLGLVAGIGIVVTASVLFVVGIARAFSALLGGVDWAGDLIAFALVMLIVGAGIFVLMTTVTKTGRRETVKKYERRKHDQRVRLGKDVREQAE